MSDLLPALSAAVRAGEPACLVTVIEGPPAGAKLLVTTTTSSGTLGNAGLDRVAERDARGALDAGATYIRHYGPSGEARGTDLTLFYESFVAPPTMLVFGAVDFTGALVRVAKVLGYTTVVCDARAAFATHQRFPLADEVLVEWPDRVFERFGDQLTAQDAVCVLTHDHKFDVPALVGATRSKAGYIGAMGSRRTHRERVERLRAAGLDDAALARIHSPIGLDLGGRTPEETAIAIAAEIIAVRTGRSGASLRSTDGPIHAPALD